MNEFAKEYALKPVIVALDNCENLSDRDDYIAIMHAIIDEAVNRLATVASNPL